MSGRILIIEDDQDMCEMLEADLCGRGFTPSWETSGNDGISALGSNIFDVILTDVNLPDINGLELCRQFSANYPDIPVVIMTAFGSMETAIAAIRAGAYDFIIKPVDLDILALSLKRAVNHRTLQEKVNLLSHAIKQTQCFEDLIGESQPMKELFVLLTRIADTDISVLITGESGSGKELCARALHQHSRRAEAPIVTVNCSAIPEALLESELFGHVRGAFTDAKTDRKGLFLEAHGGTLFLDEIGEIPLFLQPKLLRTLEERCVRPVGGNTEIPFDVRIVTATNRDLESAVEEGTFREDLFYRLNVFQLEMPPLRSRGTDILLIAKHFLEYFTCRQEKNVKEISTKVAEKLLAYPWPGNVRELRNAIEHGVVLASYDTIVPEDLPRRICSYQDEPILSGTHNPTELVSMQEVERRYILHVLKTTGGNRTLTAKILKLDRKTLYRKLQLFGVD
ncbi:MAG: sigma-54-dependent Fis family transcriptional regulator [Desulfobacteraceae bacterium]|nr:sigma-54-dependent Fis family transcriptional regulator [Desulfobacteraceae bacterium]